MKKREPELVGQCQLSVRLVLPWTSYLRDPSVMDARRPDQPPVWRELDLAALHALILEDLLGIDEAKLLRKENIHYVKTAEEAANRVRAGTGGAQCAFLTRATRMDQVRRVAEAGAVMPQKSTYFYPKALSGLVFHFFGPA